MEEWLFLQAATQLCVQSLGKLEDSLKLIRKLLGKSEEQE